MTCGDERFEHTAGPYLLGALDDAERATFAEHLHECPECREQVDQLRPVVAMLGAVSAQDVTALNGPALDGTALDGTSSLADVSKRGVTVTAADAPPVVREQEGDVTGVGADPPVPDTLLPGLLTRAAHRQRWRRGILGGAVTITAAAVIALIVVLAAGLMRPGSTPTATGQVVTMNAVNGSPIQATATVTGKPWGTEITVHCHYREGGTRHSYPAPEPPVYTLAVTDADGSVHDMGTWTVPSGRDTVFTGGTAVPSTKIERIAVLNADGKTILTATG